MLKQEQRQGRRLHTSNRGSRGAQELAINTITKKIQSGDYAPGERLNEARLSRDLGLSRNTVREVLRYLARGGLVEFETNKGARVVRMDRQDVAELFELRAVVEGLAASLAATNINHPGHRDGMAKLLQEVQTLKRESAKKALSAYPEHNAKFHNQIMGFSLNKYVIRVGADYHVPALRPQYFGFMDEQHLQKSLLEHEEIIYTILDGESARAEEIMRAHVKHAARQIHRLSDTLFNRVYGIH